MDVYVILLRIIHIFGGVFWVGAAITFFAFVEPTANALGPQAQPFIKHIVAKRRFPMYVLASTVLVVLSGILLYWRDSAGLRIEWITSPTGLGFTIGGLAGIVAFLMGPLFIVPNIRRLDALGERLTSLGRPPAPDEVAEMHAVQRTLRRYGGIDLVFLTIAVLAMASARYLG